jgi:flagellar hook-associated protein 3 FlgL
MDRVTSSMVSRSVLADIENVYGQLTTTQNELSSGKRISKPSDDPFGTSQALLDDSDLAANQQYQTNAQDMGSWLSTTDTALSSINDDLGRVRDLVLQASNGSLSQTDLDAISTELGQLADSIKSDANTQYAGSYVFSGSQTGTQPFTVGGADTYNGDSAAINRELGQGVTMQVNVTGDTVVTPILSAIRQVQTDLAAGGNTGNLATTDLNAIDAAQDTLAEQQAVVGARENRVSLATSRLQQLQQAQTQDLSNTQDADVAQAMIDFSQQSAVYQAALRAGASLIQPTLMDYLTSS